VRERGARLLSLVAEEDGYSSEFAIITALAVAAALAVGGIIFAKVTSVANSVQTK